MGLNHLCSEDYKCPDLHHALLKAMLLHTHNTFEKQKIPYFVEGGSLLGLMREGTIIPHDDDIDLGLFDKDFEKASRVLEEMCKEFNIQVKDDEGNEKTYKVHFVREKNWNHMLKIYVPNLWVENTVSKKIFGTPTIDFFSYKKAGEYVKLSNHAQRLEFKNCYYTKSEMFPLVKRKFDYLEVYSPREPIPFLHRYYGDDCLTTVKIDARRADNPKEKDRGT